MSAGECLSAPPGVHQAVQNDVLQTESITVPSWCGQPCPRVSRTLALSGSRFRPSPGSLGDDRGHSAGEGLETAAGGPQGSGGMQELGDETGLAAEENEPSEITLNTSTARFYSGRGRASQRNLPEPIRGALGTSSPTARRGFLIGPRPRQGLRGRADAHAPRFQG